MPFYGIIKMSRQWVCYRADNQFDLSTANNQMFWVTVLQFLLLHPPMALIYIQATVVMISETTLICRLLTNPRRALSPNSTVRSSKTLMWLLVSSGDQSHWVSLWPVVTSQPVWEASVVRVLLGLPWSIFLNEEGRFLTHHIKSVMRSGERVILPSKLPKADLNALSLSNSKFL